MSLGWIIFLSSITLIGLIILMIRLSIIALIVDILADLIVGFLEIFSGLGH
jgi:hypothetical protein